MVKNLPANSLDRRDMALIHEFDPWVGKDPLEEGMTTPLQYSCRENPMDRGAWRATVHEVAKSQKSSTEAT